MYDCIVNDRNDLTPKEATDILYLISTTDNYNVKINPFIDIETNLTTLVRVLENCKNHGSTFNFASSWFVYGHTQSPFNEESYCNPIGFYSITKRTAEQLLITYCQEYDIKYRILRFSNVVGPGDTGVSKKKNALTYLINQIKQGKDIDLYDNGNFTRDYIHVTDLCRAINLILSKGEVNAIYNVGNGESVLFCDMIQYAIDKVNSGSKINIISQDNKVLLKNMIMDSTKLKNLGYSPTFSTQNILDELCDLSV